MGRAGLTTDAVVDLALELVDSQGPGALTLAGVAGRAGVAPPSLYKHVRNLSELRALVALRILTELTDRVAGAVTGRSGEDAVRALMAAYRAYAVDHPGRYQALPADPLHDPSLAPAGDRLMEVVMAVLAGFGLRDSAAVHAARALRSAAHGFAVLEISGGFGLPEDLDASYALLTGMIVAGLAHPS